MIGFGCTLEPDLRLRSGGVLELILLTVSVLASYLFLSLDSYEARQRSIQLFRVRLGSLSNRSLKLELLIPHTILSL